MNEYQYYGTTVLPPLPHHSQAGSVALVELSSRPHTALQFFITPMSRRLRRSTRAHAHAMKSTSIAFFEFLVAARARNFRGRFALAILLRFGCCGCCKQHACRSIIDDYDYYHTVQYNHPICCGYD